MIGKNYIDPMLAACNEGAIVAGSTYRFSILTPGMIRMEYNACGIFEDRATQAVINRRFDVPNFRIKDNGKVLEILTEVVHVIYVKDAPFSSESLSIQLIGKYGKYAHIHRNIWRFGEEMYDLKGTTRSLDADKRYTCINTKGNEYYENGHSLNTKVQLEGGVISRFGCSVFEDKNSLIFTDDGFLEERPEGIEDSYFLGYGHDYYKCIRDFHHLCGKQPMIPRFALGNWWSRYHEYSQEEYQTLIQEFESHQIPFTVAMVDMDWHKKDERYGRGWTGYSWNLELFPQPEEFIHWMHAHGVKVSLLDHPADGVCAHENHYREMTAAMGEDYSIDDTVVFDFSNPLYIKNYFEVLCRPLEEAGVDFWWIDWTQGGKTHLKGLDPLWALNHYHSIHQETKRRRPLILSRYAGPGGHRYPISFSGDTIACWESLDYQPYFTAVSTNAGYSWWSHDIGGHADGNKDDELETRWVQFGVFSPIFRLHNTKNPFNGKEPWRYSLAAGNIMKKYMCLRHTMVPYLYTMNYLCNKRDLPIVTPMYYRYPEEEEAYQVPNEYFFGTEFLVCPITRPMDSKLLRGSFKAWIPEGIWFDFFDGTKYSGDRWLELYRGIENIPVLVRAGGIVPLMEMTEFTNSTQNPEHIRLKVFAGASGEFHLYEDDDSIGGEEWPADTEINFNWEQGTFQIKAVIGNKDCLPPKRSYTIEFIGMKETRIFSEEDGKWLKTVYNQQGNILSCILSNIEIERSIRLRFENICELAENRVKEKLFSTLDEMQIEFNLKNKIYQIILKYSEPAIILSVLRTVIEDRNLLGIIFEILTAAV